MARLSHMPSITVSKKDLALFGKTWIGRKGSLGRSPPHSSAQLGELFDQAVGQALAEMLGGIPIVRPNANSLQPAQEDCVEVGPVRVVGGVRPQNFDVGYRPDGIRFAFDSKTLNDADSIGKNWQNMVNDLATEATTVHSRFPYAVVAFMVILPRPAFEPDQRGAIVETLERLGRRVTVDDPLYMAEAISLVLWNPADGTVDGGIPAPSSLLRIEKFAEQIESGYLSRYKGLPPHAV